MSLFEQLFARPTPAAQTRSAAPLYSIQDFLTELPNTSWVSSSNTQTFMSVVQQSLSGEDAHISPEYAHIIVSNAIGYVLREENTDIKVIPHLPMTARDVAQTSEMILSEVFAKIKPVERKTLAPTLVPTF